jgi:hypothetical protein
MKRRIGGGDGGGGGGGGGVMVLERVKLASGRSNVLISVI